MTKLTAENFINELKSHQSDAEFKKIRHYFKADDPENRVIGVRMKITFDLAKQYTGMPLDEIEHLLECPYYEARMGAVSIMDFQAKHKNTDRERRKELFELFISRHDRINNWDFMDRAAPRVVGGYLYEYNQPCDVLYKLATSDNPWERRTAIVSTGYFIRKKELDDTYKIAEILLNDDHEFVQKAVGTWLRHAGKQDEKRLLDFLEKHAAEMNRTTLTTTMENLNKEQKKYFRSL